MTAVTTLPFARPLTRADLETMPDDGHRYELIDGVLFVSPAPHVRHQEMLGNLFLLVRAGCPKHVRVLFAPFAVALADDTEIQPDLLAAPRSQFTDKELPDAPMLAVEVLSTSSRRFDLLLKRDRLQEAGVPSYWLLDPEGPSITVLELENGQYVERVRATGSEECHVQLPWPMTIVPADLLD